MSSGGAVDAASPSASLAAFGLAYAALVLGPSFLTTTIGGMLSVGDLVEIGGSFVLVALAWKLYRDMRGQAGGAAAARLQEAALAASSMLYLNGIGMHVAANAVTRHLSETEASLAWRAGYFFDDVLSHLFSSAGLILMSAALLGIAVRLRPRPPSPVLLPVATLFGVSWFADAVEGRTVPLMLPAGVVAVAAILLRVRARPGALAANPVLLFYAASFGLAVGLFVAWWVWRGGFPEFSQVGWI